MPSIDQSRTPEAVVISPGPAAPDHTDLTEARIARNAPTGAILTAKSRAEAPGSTSDAIDLRRYDSPALLQAGRFVGLFILTKGVIAEHRPDPTTLRIHLEKPSSDQPAQQARNPELGSKAMLDLITAAKVPGRLNELLLTSRVEAVSPYEKPLRAFIIALKKMAESSGAALTKDQLRTLQSMVKTGGDHSDSKTCEVLTDTHRITVSRARPNLLMILAIAYRSVRDPESYPFRLSACRIICEPRDAGKLTQHSSTFCGLSKAWLRGVINGQVIPTAALSVSLFASHQYFGGAGSAMGVAAALMAGITLAATTGVILSVKHLKKAARD